MSFFKQKETIHDSVRCLMDEVLRKVLVEDRFLEHKHRIEQPLYAALVPDEIFKWSYFERLFVTVFNSIWKDLAVVAAKKSLGFSSKGHVIVGTVKTGRLRHIQHVLNRGEHPIENGKEQIPLNWKSELQYILRGRGQDIPVQIVCDVYAEDTTHHKKYAFELKAPLSNSDQTKVSKEKLLKLYSMEPLQIDGAYYALPYNPYGTRENYSWSFPARWFNMKEDQVVLIGNEFWEKIGGIGTYQAFITAVNEIGKEYKERIYREFLGIEPPPDFEQGQLQ